MATVLFRTLIIYVILIGAMRLMGKRQIGELRLSELITTLMLSEFAVIPMQNTDIPVAYAIIPIILLLTIEVVSSYIFSKSPKLHSVMHGKASLIIRQGELLQGELPKLRISLNELLAELRQKNIADISDVEYAILEENGKLSVFTKAEKNSYTPSDAGLSPQETGIAHAVITDGKINRTNLALSRHDEKWLTQRVRSAGCDVADVFLMTVDDADKVKIFRKVNGNQ